MRKEVSEVAMKKRTEKKPKVKKKGIPDVLFNSRITKEKKWKLLYLKPKLNQKPKTSSSD